MCQIIQFPHNRPARLCGVFTENELIAAQHMVRQRKAKYIQVSDLPPQLRRSRLGEWAKRGLRVEGYAVTEYENLCLYLSEQAL